MKPFVLNALLLVVATVVALLVGEGVAQLYAHHIAKKGKLFEPDAQLGWKTCPSLALTRRNTDGDLWFIETDSTGKRISSSPTTVERRNFILGDSFGFGEGINIEDRFDAVLQAAYPDEAWTNLGVMGYGTDQQVLSLEPFRDQLQPGDRVILLTYFNDFHDILQTAIAGRSKPYFAWQAGSLAHHPPQWSASQYIRDRSYTLSRLMMLLEEQHSFEPADLEEAIEVYEALVATYLYPLRERGIEVVLAYHGLPLTTEAMQQRMQESIEGVCNKSDMSCLHLDPLLAVQPAHEIFQADKHWTPAGHAIVGQALYNLIAEPTEQVTP